MLVFQNVFIYSFVNIVSFLSIAERTSQPQCQIPT